MRKSRLSQYKQNRLIELFVAGATARTAASLISVNKTTASYYFHRLRCLILENNDSSDVLTGEIEVGESYFCGKRKGKRGRGAAGKVRPQHNQVIFQMTDGFAILPTKNCFLPRLNALFL